MGILCLDKLNKEFKKKFQPYDTVTLHVQVCRVQA